MRVKCIYCLQSRPHPRLARGENYSCGYKPYRCEICKYSTTTKGNLSIHMQSDKHLHAMQEMPSIVSEKDRSRPALGDISVLHGMYQCNLCPYNTSLKANFQLHTRTDKHIQKVQMVCFLQTFSEKYFIQ
ncbi:unnamed protein product [Dracunculus medinensis]|uniref:C2H2-type domain-containing protein n=1 Tax=Dracunculus medinensis TaxID=318479 RepID=A0A0N4U8I2_DRAME|nr:unnamed protein product [Dracunculus medinensis]